MIQPTQSKSARGISTVLVIGFMGIFLVVLGTISSFTLQESRYTRALFAREQAFHVAESGLEYYRWFLAHNPNNITNGTGTAGPYNYAVKDPETNTTIGNASISVSASTQCGVIQYIDITSVGTAVANTGFPRTLQSRYMQPSVAGYSYILNSNVEAGATRNITGPYFSNGGINMMGTNNSDVSSAVSTWNCDASYGCSPASGTAPGVTGSGSGYALWHWPSASIAFSNITASLSNLKGYAKNNGGVYFPTVSNGSNKIGYHITFKSDGTFDVYKVTATVLNIWGSAKGDDSDWTKEQNIIASQTYLGNYAIPAACSVIFVEDRIWVDGIVSRKVTLASANIATSSDVTSAFLPNNITYSTYDGSVGLSVIAVGDVLIPVNSPDTMEIHGIFVAQTGRFGRNLYHTSSDGTHGVPSAYDSGVKQAQLTTGGSVISSLRTGTAWVDGFGTTISGYQTRIDSYDELQAVNPPPFTPFSNATFKFTKWQEL